MKVDSDQSKASLVHSELYVRRTDGMVIIGHRSSKSTFGANKLMFHMYTWEGWQSFFFLFHRYTLEGSFGRAFPHYLVAAGLDKEKFRCLLLKPLFVSRFCGKVLIGLDKQGRAGGGVLEGDSGFC